jgi:hypothetical protein
MGSEEYGRSWSAMPPYPMHTVYQPQAAPHIGHQQHLCYMCESGGCTLEQVKALVKDAKFVCKKCGRAAVHEENLCEPVPL